MIARNAQTVLGGFEAIARCLYVHSPALTLTVSRVSAESDVQFTYDVTEPGVPYPTQSYELPDFDPTYTVRHGCSTAWGDRSAPETALLPTLFVAFNVGPVPRRVAVRLFSAAADDVEPAVVVLDVGVAEPHVLIGCAVGECHGNCHGRSLQMRRPTPARVR